MIDWRGAALTAMLLSIFVEAAGAQTRDPALRRHRLTLSGGLNLSGGYSIGDRQADLRPNTPGSPMPAPFFRAESRFDGAQAFEARLGYALRHALSIEVGGMAAHPRLAVSVSGDAEADSVAVVAEEISQYSVDVSGVYEVPYLKLPTRARPYAIAGIGYLWQLHEERVLVERGQIVHIGGGIRYFLRGGSAQRRALGVRADARFVRRLGGVDFEEKGRNFPALSVLGFAEF